VKINNHSAFKNMRRLVMSINRSTVLGSVLLLSAMVTTGGSIYAAVNAAQDVKEMEKFKDGSMSALFGVLALLSYARSFYFFRERSPQVLFQPANNVTDTSALLDENKENELTVTYNK
jgi:hypothetical protein